MRYRIAALALLVVGASCRDAAGPEKPSGPEALTLDVVVGGDLEAGGSAQYVFRSTTPVGVELAVTAVSGAIAAAVRDSASGGEITIARAAAASLAGPSAKTTPFQVTPGHPILVRLAADSAAPASFRARIYRTSAGPESRSPRFAIGDTVRESHSGHGDVDVFTFEAAGGEEVLLAGRALQPTESLKGILRHESSGDLVASFWLMDSGAGPLDWGTGGPITLPAAGRYTLSVTNQEEFSIADSARYEFQVRLLDRGPEGRSAAVAPGDSIDQALESVGDIDEYVLTASPGAELSLFLRGRGVRGHLRLYLEGPGFPLREVLAIAAGDSVPLLRRTPRFTLPASGPYTLSVAGDLYPDVPSRGAYHLFIYPVDRAPETASSSLAERDTSIAETLELPGDIDEFAFSLAAPTYVHAAVLRAGSGSDPVRMDVVRADRDSVVAAATLDALFGADASDRRGTATTLLPAGAYRIRVSSPADDGTLPYLGAFRVVWTTVDDGPEGRSAVVAPGDSVAETLTTGDIDRYRFAGDSGQRLDIAFGISPASGEPRMWPGLGLRVRDAARPDWWIAGVMGPATGTIPDTLRTYRFDLPAAGEYVIEVAPTDSGQLVDNVGTYHFTLRPYPALPEHTAVAVAVGERVTAERLDELGDVDSLVVTGAPGEEIVVGATLPPGGRPSGEAYLPGDSVRHLDGGSLGRMTIPATGGIPLLVRERDEQLMPFGLGASRFGSFGPYEIWSYAIDRAPEDRSPLAQLGDTVASRLEVVGDVDEYTVAAAAGDTLRAVVYQQGGEDVGLTVLAPGGAPVGGVRTTCAGCYDAQAETSFVAPTSGSYTVRVTAISDRFGTPSYWFLLARH